MYLSLPSILLLMMMTEPLPDQGQGAMEWQCITADEQQQTLYCLPSANQLITEDDTAQQVRVKRRLIIRVPHRAGNNVPLSSLAPLPRSNTRPQRYKLRKIGKCINVKSIASMQVLDDDRLILRLRDRRMIRADLEGSCHGQDFYQGIYLRENDDGNLCVGRDLIQARSGSRCEIERIREMVPIRD